MSFEIPFNRPFIAGKELYYIAQAVAFGNIAGDGIFTRRCSEFLQERFGIGRALMTPSCTAALEMAAVLCGLEPGDEVILPSFTFVSTANAFVRLGARPRFVDIRRDTLNIDETRIEEAINPRVKAIFPVHYAGVACEMDAITSIADAYGLKVVEDAAQGVDASYKGRALGSIGQMGAYSFHETKNFICGEGGALCLNDPELVERAEILRDKGTNRQQFLRGMVDKYTWVDVGSSNVPSEIASAFLYAQLEMMGPISERRRGVYGYYLEHLEHLRAAGLLGLPHVPAHCRGNTHLFYVLLRDRRTRDDLLAFLRARGIEAVFHYVPLHTSPMGAKLGYAPGDLPVTEDMAGRLLRLPVFQEITEEAQASVVEAIGAYFDWGQPEESRGGADGSRIPRRRPRTTVAGIGG